MAIYHLTAQYISRNKGRSAVGASAYRAGEKLHNKYDGQTHDFTGKRGIVHNEIMLPENAPPEFADRETFWNAVELNEKRKDAQTAREIEIALPNELNLDEQIQLVREYVRNNFISENMCADICIHAGKHYHNKDKRNVEAEHDKIITPDNPHAHIMLTLRPIDKDGNFANKNREWNKTEYLINWRKNWADIQNREFERKGLDVRVSHESNADRGIDQEPTIHMGHEATAQERRGIRTRRGNVNRGIVARNRAKQKARADQDRLQRNERKQSRIRSERLKRKFSKEQQDREQKKHRINTDLGNGGSTMLNAIQAEDRKGRAKARKHITEIKNKAERERLEEEAQRAKEEREALQRQRRREHEERKAEMERKRKEEEKEREKEKDHDRDSPSRSR